VIFSEVLGAETARGLLARLLTSGRVPHAILFHGPEGVGKAKVAKLFAASLLCETPRDGAACGACPACLKVEHGNHPDLLTVTRLPKGGASADPGDEDDGEDSAASPSGKKGELRSFILVSQVRAMIEHAAYAPREGRRRIFLIDPADRLLPEAQNALLKTLEEPPGEAVVLLVASRPHVLLPTVRSRCFHLGFGAMAPEALEQALAARGVPRSEARARAALSEGRPGKAIDLDVPSRIKRRDTLLAALGALAAAPAAAADLSAIAAEIVGEDESSFLEGLDLAAALLRDAFRSAAGSRAIAHADARPAVAALGCALGAERAAELVALADGLRRDLRLNLNKTLVAESLLAAVAGAPVPRAF
jgi:DNA polymerase-3 subunit delta'